MSEFKMILVSQLGVNDEKANLVKWESVNGDEVEKGEVICILETTKAAYDVETEYGGYIAHLVDEGDSVLVGQPLAIISSTYEEATNQKKIFKSEVAKKNKERERGVFATKKAEQVARECSVNLKDITPVFGAIIRESDVLKYVESARTKSKELIINLEIDMIPVVVYGAGLGGSTINETLSLGDTYQVVCYIDDNSAYRTELDGIPVYSDSFLKKIIGMGVKHAITGVSNGYIRKKIAKKLTNFGFELINAIHPNSFVSPTVKIGVSNHIKAGSVIDTNTTIGSFCIIDNGAIIAHDNVIEDGCHIAPGAIFGSKIHLGANTVVGIGASISTNINIGEKCIISVGAAITQNVDSFLVIDGVPGRVIGKTKG
jgi:sugar O-acyltransferase (sialic acid O-acetyltransferase NeuD family)